MSQRDPKAALALTLKNGRVKAGMTQREVSALLGYSTPQFISNWERGVSSPPLRQLKKLAKLYGIDADAIYEIMLADAIGRVTEGLHREFYGRRKA